MTTLAGFHHVKLPVSDIDRSREWYERVLGLTVDIEFVEDGTVKGVALVDAGTVSIALRLDPARAAAMSGFDAIALAVPTRADVARWQDRIYAAVYRMTGDADDARDLVQGLIERGQRQTNDVLSDLEQSASSDVR